MTFTRGEAECLPVAAASVQLVVVGRAIHYFDTRAFFREVDRVLVGDHTLLSYVYVALQVDTGVVAYYCMHFPTVIRVGDGDGDGDGDGARAAAVTALFNAVLERLGPYWPTNPHDGFMMGSASRREHYVR